MEEEEFDVEEVPEEIGNQPIFPLETREERIDDIRDFAEALFKIVSNFKTRQEKDYEDWLGVKKEDMLLVVEEYPLYEKTQAVYAINKLIEETGKIYRVVGYIDGRRTAPDFKDIEIKRNKFETLMTKGKIFFSWKGKKFIAGLYFRGDYAEVTFLYRKKDQKTMKKFLEALRTYMNEHNYFKGEKLEFLPSAELRFLSFPKLTWEDLILSKKLMEEIELNLLFLLRNEKACKKANVPWRRGVLLAGIPGTGKTQLGRVLCNVLKGVTVVWTTPKALTGCRRVKQLFDVARKLSPSLIVLEDLDFYGHDREVQTDPIIGELLNQLDGSAPNEGVFVLATTNRPYLLDRALANRPGRFDVKLLFEPPAFQERLRMILHFSKGKNLQVDPNKLASLTDKLTGAQIKEVINYATILALKEKEESVKLSHFKRALQNVRAKLESEKSRMVS